MADWKRRNYVDDCPHRVAVKSMAYKAAAETVVVKSDDGGVRRVPAVEIDIEQLFRNGIAGDVKAQKAVIRMALKYWEPPPARKKETVWRRTRAITQDDVDCWKASGSLPENCSDVLSEISLRDLNRAYRAYNKKTNDPTPKRSLAPTQQDALPLETEQTDYLVE